MSELKFIVNDPENPPVVDIIGPFEGEIYRLIVDGCTVPNVRLLNRRGIVDEVEFDWFMVVDDRFGIFTSTDEILRWGYVFANAMAISAGYTCHGPNSKTLNRFAVRAIEIEKGEFG